MFTCEVAQCAEQGDIISLHDGSKDRSLIYIKNSRGPSIDPGETPVVIVSVVDYMLFNSTYCCLVYM